MLFTCRPPGTAIPGRFPGPRMLAENGSRSTSTVTCCAKRRAIWSPRRTCRIPVTVTTARKPRRRPPSTRSACCRSFCHWNSGFPTWTRWGSTSRRCRPRPTDLLRPAARPRDRRDPPRQRQHRRDHGQAPRPLRRARHRAVPGARAGGRRAGAPAQIIGPQGHRDRRQRPGRGLFRPQIPPDLRPRSRSSASSCSCTRPGLPMPSAWGRGTSAI